MGGLWLCTSTAGTSFNAELSPFGCPAALAPTRSPLPIAHRQAPPQLPSCQLRSLIHAVRL